MIKYKEQITYNLDTQFSETYLARNKYAERHFNLFQMKDCAYECVCVCVCGFCMADFFRYWSGAGLADAVRGVCAGDQRAPSAHCELDPNSNIWVTVYISYS